MVRLRQFLREKKVASYALIALLVSGCLILLNRIKQPDLIHTIGDESYQIFVANNNVSDIERCSPSEVATLFVNFFSTLKTGDKNEVMAYFGKDFAWYSMASIPDSNIAYVVDEENPAMYLPSNKDKKRTDQEVISQLADYLISRQEVNEVITLRQVATGGNSRTHTRAALIAARKADDLDANRWGPRFIARGKVDINCDENKINVLSMGMVPSEQANISYCSGILAFQNAWLQDSDYVMAC